MRRRHPAPSTHRDPGDLSLEIVLHLERKGGLASERAVEVFRSAGRISPASKAQVMGDVHGFLRQARRVDFALETAGAPERGARQARARLLAARLLDGKIRMRDAREQFPEVDWSQVAGVGTRIGQESDPVRRFALTHSLTDALAQALLEAYGEEAEALARSLEQPAPRTLRVNTLKVSRDQAEEALSEEGLQVRATPFSPVGLALEGTGEPFGTEAFREGWIEMQDQASQLIAELVSPSPGSLVVDACAGAGGKTLALAAWMKNRGVLAAIDTHDGRLAEFKRRARRAGVSCHRILCADLCKRPWPPALAQMEGLAARVLVDAPCTGTGALRRNPEARGRIGAEELERFPKEQEAIARAALALCKPKGRLIYATCSLLPVENERVVERLLDDSRFTLVPIAEILGAERGRALSDSTGRYLKLRPDLHGTDGFFAAVLRREK